MCRLACGYSAEEEPSEIKLLIDIDKVTCNEILRLDDKEKKLKGAPRTHSRGTLFFFWQHLHALRHEAYLLHLLIHAPAYIVKA
jgi:hypothetical protein